MVNKSRLPIPVGFSRHELDDNGRGASSVEYDGPFESLHTMPSITSVISEANEEANDASDTTSPLSPSLSTAAPAIPSAATAAAATTTSTSLPNIPTTTTRKARPPSLNRAALHASFPLQPHTFGPKTPKTPFTPKTPASGYLEAERNRFFNSYPSLPTTPHSPYLGSGRAMTPEAGMYQASINVSLTNVALRARKASTTRHALVNPDEKVEKPWLEDKKRLKMHRIAYWTFTLTILAGIAGSAMLMYSAWANVARDNYCLVLEDNFDSPAGLDRSVWFHEQETGGFGNGQFEWTTDHINNTFVEDGTLYIVPTLTSDHLGADAISDGYTLNLTARGTCTATENIEANCAVTSNATTGVILPPVQSARIMTNFSRTIRFGRVEVRARMPTGNWLWPAIWMLPKDSVYGPWPRSGEIDIVESKGNMPRFRGDDAANNMRSALHFGPVWLFDGYGLASKVRKLWHKYYNEEFHTFGLEWTEDGIYMWEKSPVWKSLSLKFKQGFWKLGQFPPRMGNGTLLDNPWAGVPEPYAKVAPFDQEFYLVMDVAVGGTNGFFLDKQGDNKPWSNDAYNARSQFWGSREQWLATWPKDPRRRGMAIDYVKMWQKC